MSSYTTAPRSLFETLDTSRIYRFWGPFWPPFSLFLLSHSKRTPKSPPNLPENCRFEGCVLKVGDHFPKWPSNPLTMTPFSRVHFVPPQNAQHGPPRNHPKCHPQTNDRETSQRESSIFTNVKIRKYESSALEPTSQVFLISNSLQTTILELSAFIVTTSNWVSVSLYESAYDHTKWRKAHDGPIVFTVCRKILPIRKSS